MDRKTERSNTQVNYGDYESILSKYRQSITTTTMPSPQLESIQEDEQQKFSIDQMEKDTENSKRLRKTNDMDLVNVNELIFQRVLQENELKQLKVGKTDCCICHKQFGLRNKLKQCKFCGNCVCGDHSKKRRKEPKGVRFRRVCEICDDKYIRLSVEKHYIQKRDELAKQALDLDSESQALLQQIKDKEKYISEVKQESIKRQGEHRQTQNELIFKISKLENEMKSMTEESKKQQGCIKGLEREIKDLDVQLQEKNTEANKKKQQQALVEEEIEHTDLECQRVQLEIEKLHLELQTKKQKEYSQQSQGQVQIKQKQETYSQYILTQESTTIQQYDPYEKQQQQPSKPQQKDDEVQKGEKSCCKIM